MDLALLVKVDHLHHAYIVAGGTSAGVGEMLAKRGIGVTANPDYLALSYQELSVDDARTIAQYAFLKSVSGAKYFVVSLSRASDGAQNALLKVIEEAPGGSHFFFCVPQAGVLIPTIRSRCIEVQADGVRGTEDGAHANEFFSEAYADRIARVEKMLKALEKSKDRAEVRAFVRALVVSSHERRLAPQHQRSILSTYNYLSLTGSSPKLLLMHLAVTLPQA
jgi:hypothetical protein